MWNRISFKLIVATGGVAFAIITVFAYLILDAQQRQLLSELERSANQLSETIKSSTRHDMLLNRSESVDRIINTIAAQDGIDSTVRLRHRRIRRTACLPIHRHQFTGRIGFEQQGQPLENFCSDLIAGRLFKLGRPPLSPR